MEGATHVDLYDRDEHVTQAVTQISQFFTEALVDGGIEAAATGRG